MSTTFFNWHWIIVICAILVGCHAPKGINEISFEEAPSFRMSGTEVIGEYWWTAFEDISLDQHVREALEGSFTLTAARERVRAANALSRRESAALYPELEGMAGARYRETDGTEGVKDFELGFEVGYEVDLWGRIDSLVEAEQLRGKAEEEAYHAAALSLSAQVTIIVNICNMYPPGIV